MDLILNRVAGEFLDNERETFIEELELAREACRPFDLGAFREGHLTPVYFGSALRNFGVRDLIEGLGASAPSPRDQEADFPPRSRDRGQNNVLRVQN